MTHADPHDDAIDRRGLFARAGRLAAFGIIAGAAGTLAARGQLSQAPCTRDHVCRGCGTVTQCGLPQALSFKQATESQT
jgi:hypothetical protein